MGISPFTITGRASEFLAEVPDRMVEIEHDFIKELAKLLGRDDLAARYRADRRRVLDELRASLQEASDKRWMGSKEFNKGFNSFVANSLEADERIFQAAAKAGLTGAVAGPLSASGRIQWMLAREYKKVEDVLGRIRMTGIDSAVGILDRALAGAATGEASIDRAIRDAMNEFAESGITGHVYPSGRKISMAPYARRELVTSMMRTARELGFERAKDWGSDLIQVSAHAGARPLCFPFQGRVFSLGGGHSKYMALEETSYGEPAGLFGINCRHFHWPFFEGLNDEYTADQKDPARLLDGPTNADVYDATQVQRYNERQIRKWKRRRDELSALGVSTTRADEGIKEWQARQRAFIRRSQAENIDLRRDYLREKA